MWLGKITSLFLVIYCVYSSHEWKELEHCMIISPHNAVLAFVIQVCVLVQQTKWGAYYSTMVTLLDLSLSNHYQGVAINNCYFDLLPVISGMPQDSIHGPLLFLVYTNNMWSCIQGHSKQSGCSGFGRTTISQSINKIPF